MAAAQKELPLSRAGNVADCKTVLGYRAKNLESSIRVAARPRRT